MSLRIEVAELGLPALDALDVDALLVFVGPERPLQGLAGFADWRLCGAISRTIRSGLFQATAGEALLLPSGGRMRPPRIFCMGLPAVPLAPETFLLVAREGCEALARAGSDAFATAMPPIAGDATTAARRWLEASVARPVKRQVLLGEARAIQRELVAAKEALRAADVEVVAPPSRVELPRRALPHVGGVLR